MPTLTKAFVCYYYFVGWDCLSLGISLSWSAPNIEIHLPFGFVRIGWSMRVKPRDSATLKWVDSRTFGWASDAD